MAAEEFREAFAPGGETEAKAGAAFMAACSVDAHQGATGGAKLRPLFAFFTKHSAKHALPAVQPVLPSIGKSQLGLLACAHTASCCAGIYAFL